MDSRSLLSDAVLQAAALLPTVPDDLAHNLDALKARRDQEPSREPEDELAKALAGEMGPYMQQVAEQIVNGQPPDTRSMDDRILVLLLLGLIGAATASTRQRAQALGVELSIDTINQRATQWAQTYTYELVRGINETTRQAISNAVTAYTQAPGMTIDEVAQLLEPTFGQVRANMIATTEITRAYGQAATITQAELLAQGVYSELQWVTYNDDRVCKICGPLHNAIVTWSLEYPNGPPAHVNCRCWLANVKVT